MDIFEARFYNAINTALQSEFPAYSELNKLFNLHGSWQKVWKERQKEYRLDVDAEWQKLEKLGVRLVMRGDSDFPALLEEIPWKPFGIYVKGNLSPCEGDRLAIVGTRKATKQGIEVARSFARELAEKGITVVSGLALGIDEAAHKGVIACEGRTIAVLAVGLDRVYPRQNFNLAKKILELGGALISEYPPDSTSYPSRFVERNRIISGLSKGVIIIEAPQESGALATARFALEQNRDVLVVPGPAGHPNYIGSCKLIRSGASLVNSVDDVLEDLNIELSKTSKDAKERQFQNLDEEQKRIVAVLEKEGGVSDIETMSQLLKLDISNLSRHLTFLLLRGIIKESGGRYYL